MIEYKFIEVYKRGFVQFDLPSDILGEIKTEARRMIDTNFSGLTRWNDNLVGSIEHEYHYNSNAKLLPFLKQAAKTYAKQWQNFDGFDKKFFENDYEYCINPKNGKTETWINFQKRYEYNPMHIHNGFLSFVLWVNIPFDRSTEQATPRLRHTDNQYVKTSVADFKFYIPDHFNSGGITSHTLPVDRQYEGKVILFDASMHHAVNPFYTSDDYRVSISGNLTISN